MTVTVQQPSATSQKRIGWRAVTGLVTGIVLAVVKALLWSNGIISAEVLGYAAAGIIIPLLIAYAIAGRAAKRDWDRFGSWFAALTLLALILEITGRR